MKNRTILLALSCLALGPSAWADDAPEPCVEQGKSLSVAFPKPRLLSGGTPVDAVWKGGDDSGEPVGMDEDLFSDDTLGPATPTSGGATIAIKNVDGDLVGPNGDDVLGFGEGDCIEVYIEWTYLYPVTQTSSASLMPTGVGGRVTQSHLVWVEGKKKSKVKEVCPC